MFDVNLANGFFLGLDFWGNIYNHMVVNSLNSTFAALSDPTRRTIVDRLTRGPATVNQLAKPFDITQQAISKHLIYLERAHLIEKTRIGRERFCVLKPGPIREIARWADDYRRFLNESFERLDALLGTIEEKER
jgi:DNA-binding transcriptional ArsR family regulator